MPGAPSNRSNRTTCIIAFPERGGVGQSKDDAILWRIRIVAAPRVHEEAEAGVGCSSESYSNRTVEHLSFPFLNTCIYIYILGAKPLLGAPGIATNGVIGRYGRGSWPYQ